MQQNHNNIGFVVGYMLKKENVQQLLHISNSDTEQDHKRWFLSTCAQELSKRLNIHIYFFNRKSQFVCLGGTPKRMEQFAFYIMEEIGHKLPSGTTLQDISRFSYRYSMYKVGPVLSISVSFNCSSLSWTDGLEATSGKMVNLFSAWNGHTIGWHSFTRID